MVYGSKSTDQYEAETEVTAKQRTQAKANFILIIFFILFIIFY